MTFLRCLLVAVPALLVLELAPLAAGFATQRQLSAAELVERYRPVLRYDADEDYFAQPISRSAERIDRDLVYGRIAESDGQRWIQYWIFYAYNTQDRGFLETGRHEGDWEFVQLRLGEDGVPEAATFAQHSWAESCGIDRIETKRLGGAEVPIVFVANGSHASYPHAGTADRPWPDPNDEADGAVPVRPSVEVIGDAAWALDPSTWGDSEAGWFPGEQSSPPGPMFQSDRRWQEPGGYEAAARACGEGPPGRPWQTPALIGLATLLVAPMPWLIGRRSAGRA